MGIFENTSSDQKETRIRAVQLRLKDIVELICRIQRMLSVCSQYPHRKEGKLISDANENSDLRAILLLCQNMFLPVTMTPGHVREEPFGESMRG